MRTYQGFRFSGLMLKLLEDFNDSAEPVDVGQWQGLNIKGDPLKVTWELREVILSLRMPESVSQAQQEIQPNLPWAEDHFLERVSGVPHNPPPSQAWWPFIQNGHSEHFNNGQFSHTYPERFWPKHAGHHICNCDNNDNYCDYGPRTGIRYDYGDLRNVVNRLTNNPLTRQAYLPVWFPEDTGAPAHERVPCTLGYLFMIRDNRLHVTYHIRSCDFMRHFRDDVYMATRLGQWMRDEVDLGGIQMGDLTMHVSSFHIFAGDRAMVRHMVKEAGFDNSSKLLGELS